MDDASCACKSGCLLDTFVPAAYLVVGCGRGEIDDGSGGSGKVHGGGGGVIGCTGDGVRRGKDG